MAEENISIPRMRRCCKSFFKTKFFRTKNTTSNTKQECYDKNTYSFVSYM